MLGEVISEVVVLATLRVESLFSGGLILDRRMLRLYEVSRIEADLMGIYEGRPPRWPSALVLELART